MKKTTLCLILNLILVFLNVKSVKAVSNEEFNKNFKREDFCGEYEECYDPKYSEEKINLPSIEKLNKKVNSSLTPADACSDSQNILTAKIGPVKSNADLWSYLKSQAKHFTNNEEVLIKNASKAFSLSSPFLGCLVLRESRFENGLQNKFLATGLGQLRPDAYQWILESFKKKDRLEYANLVHRWKDFWGRQGKASQKNFKLSEIKNNKELAIATTGYLLKATHSLLGYDQPDYPVPGLTKMQKELLISLSYNGGASFGQYFIKKCSIFGTATPFMNCIRENIASQPKYWELCRYFHSIERCMKKGQKEAFDDYASLKQSCPHL